MFFGVSPSESTKGVLFSWGYSTHYYKHGHTAYKKNLRQTFYYILDSFFCIFLCFNIFLIITCGTMFLFVTGGYHCVMSTAICTVL